MQNVSTYHSDYDYLFRISIIGDSGVGKSSILGRYADDAFSEAYVSTIGVDFKIRTFELEGKRIKLQLWDTAGQERFAGIVRSFYRGAHGFIVVYDVTCRGSFENTQTWLKEIDTYGTHTHSCLIGNKVDLQEKRQISYEEGKCFADALGMNFLETSAKSSVNVEHTFHSLAAQLLNAQVEKEISLQQSEDEPKINSKPVDRKSEICCSIV